MERTVNVQDLERRLDRIGETLDQLRGYL